MYRLTCMFKFTLFTIGNSKMFYIVYVKVICKYTIYIFV